MKRKCLRQAAPRALGFHLVENSPGHQFWASNISGLKIFIISHHSMERRKVAVEIRIIHLQRGEFVIGEEETHLRTHKFQQAHEYLARIFSDTKTSIYFR